MGATFGPGSRFGGAVPGLGLNDSPDPAAKTMDG